MAIRLHSTSAAVSPMVPVLTPPSPSLVSAPLPISPTAQSAAVASISLSPGAEAEMISNPSPTIASSASASILDMFSSAVSALYKFLWSNVSSSSLAPTAASTRSIQWSTNIFLSQDDHPANAILSPGRATNWRLDSEISQRRTWTRINKGFEETYLEDSANQLDITSIGVQLCFSRKPIDASIKTPDYTVAFEEFSLSNSLKVLATKDLPQDQHPLDGAISPGTAKDWEYKGIVLLKGPKTDKSIHKVTKCISQTWERSKGGFKECYYENRSGVLTMDGVLQDTVSWAIRRIPLEKLGHEEKKAKA